jgi:glycosyltransferase involved in cell wall biosynthesis
MVHVAHPNLASLGLLVKLLRPRIPYAVAAYGIDVWRPLPVLRRLGLRSATAVAALSRFTAEKLIEVQGVRSSKIKNLPPAVDPGLERKRGMATVPRPPLPRGKILLTVARLETSERDKGVETVIQALPTVHRSFPDTYYVIVGDGDDRQRLERLAKDTGVASHVLFSSKVGYELVGYYDACDVFVMPSRKEGFGIVFLEAMACGKPVVGGKHGGTPECVEDGTTGFLVEYGDVITLADRLIRLLRDEGLRRRMGEAGQRRVNEEYSFEHFRERLVCLLTKTDPSSS